MDLYEIGKGLRDDLRSNLTDPIGRSSVGGGQWIHLKDLSNVGKTPTIHIERLPGGDIIEIVGNTSPDRILRYNVYVITKNTDIGINADGNQADNTIELRDDLVQSTLSRLESIGKTFTSGGAVTIFAENPEGGLDIGGGKEAVTIPTLVHTS